MRPGTPVRVVGTLTNRQDKACYVGSNGTVVDAHTRLLEGFVAVELCQPKGLPWAGRSLRMAFHVEELETLAEEAY
jgi:hypothetical protein